MGRLAVGGEVRPGNMQKCVSETNEDMGKTMQGHLSKSTSPSANPIKVKLPFPKWLTLRYSLKSDPLRLAFSILRQ